MPPHTHAAGTLHARRAGARSPQLSRFQACLGRRASPSRSYTATATSGRSRGRQVTQRSSSRTPLLYGTAEPPPELLSDGGSDLRLGVHEYV
ncbi:hypothetical protein H180DRAFT_00508 [Streptomyces sp. WMMB 322]|nr:hypothetical protein H180DRAFT_00508 [Streptomyces sp. WMMB 322]